MVDKYTAEYYTTKQHLLKVFDTSSRKYAFDASDTSEFKEWKNVVKTVLADITGLDRMKKCDMSPRILNSEKLDGFTRTKLLIQTEKEVWMPFYEMIPDDIKDGEKRPCIIAPHGHQSCGKHAVAGRSDIPSVKMAIDKFNYDYGVQLVKEGYIVLCPDARGSGERREWMTQGDEDEKMLACSCTDLNNAAISIGQSLMGMFVWDLMRLTDYASDMVCIDSSRIGCCGFSGGGNQAIWFTAMDDRIKCSVISGFFHGYRDTLLRSSRCGCNFIPHLWETVDMGDLGAMAAPRPILVENGRDDQGNGERGIEGAEEQIEIVRRAYRLFSKEEVLERFIFEGGHIWNGERTVAFLKKWL